MVSVDEWWKGGGGGESGRVSVCFFSGMRIGHVLVSYEEEVLLSQWVFLFDCLRA